MKTKPSSERGQALVLIALAFLVLIGFTALAIDGGMTYSDRRISQAVSDSASLAGGGLAALHLENEHIFSSVLKIAYNFLMGRDYLKKKNVIGISAGAIILTWCPIRVKHFSSEQI